MEIRQFRVVLKATNFDRTCRFYGEVMSLPRLQSWERGEGRGALFQAGGGIVEVRGRTGSGETVGERTYDEEFDYQGPQHKLTLSLVVPSAEQAYEELLFRDSNIPGGLRQRPDGSRAFVTHDPDGVQIVLHESESRGAESRL